jgi:hypothetical protein
MPKYSSPAQPTTEEELGFTPLEDTPYIRFLFKQLDARDKRIAKLKTEVDKLKWEAVHNQIDKEYVEAFGPQVELLKSKVAALQAHSEARKATAKEQTAKWKEIAKQYAPSDVVAQAEFENQMNDLTLDIEGEQVQAGVRSRGNGLQDVEIGG